jgi:hypothetical protein
LVADQDVGTTAWQSCAIEQMAAVQIKGGPISLETFGCVLWRQWHLGFDGFCQSSAAPLKKSQ